MKLHLATGLVFVLATTEVVGAKNWFTKAGMSLMMYFVISAMVSPVDYYGPRER